MNNKKISAIVLIVIIALLTYFLYSKNKNLPSVSEPATTFITYTNNDFGFSFSLPTSWKGYTIVKSTWQGTPLTATSTQESGPKLLIRNPKWTTALHYEDIPLLVFTLDQWKSYTTENFNVSAAPILASELARNNMYVFALPPRWDFDYSEGYVDAQNILKNNPIKAYSI